MSVSGHRGRMLRRWLADERRIQSLLTGCFFEKATPSPSEKNEDWKVCLERGATEMVTLNERLL